MARRGKMSKIVDEFEISEYTVLRLDKMPESEYYKFRIEGREFEPVPIYDMPKCIAIEAKGNFVGKTVEFI